MSFTHVYKASLAIESLPSSSVRPSSHTPDSIENEIRISLYQRHHTRGMIRRLGPAFQSHVWVKWKRSREIVFVPNWVSRTGMKSLTNEGKATMLHTTSQIAPNSSHVLTRRYALRGITLPITCNVSTCNMLIGWGITVHERHDLQRKRRRKIRWMLTFYVNQLMHSHECIGSSKDETVHYERYH